MVKEDTYAQRKEQVCALELEEDDIITINNRGDEAKRNCP